LLKPTALYPSLMKKAMSIGGIHAAAHITGGGLDNITRVLPKGVEAEINSWSVPAPFLEVKSRSKMAWMDLLKTLNCGIGFVLVVEADKFDQLKTELVSEGHLLMDLGVVKATENAEAEAEASWKLAESSWEGY